MGNKRRGLALIFNQEHFFWHLRLSTRNGTNADRYNLEKRYPQQASVCLGTWLYLFSSCKRFQWKHCEFPVCLIASNVHFSFRLRDLNFEVRIYENFKQVDVITKICEGTSTWALWRLIWLVCIYSRSCSSNSHLIPCFLMRTNTWNALIPVIPCVPPAAAEDHSDADCFLLAFLSHGEDDHVYAYDGKIKIQAITDMFKGDKCQSLAGKPKIFVLQVHSNRNTKKNVVHPMSTRFNDLTWKSSMSVSRRAAEISTTIRWPSVTLWTVSPMRWWWTPAPCTPSRPGLILSCATLWLKVSHPGSLRVVGLLSRCKAGGLSF